MKDIIIKGKHIRRELWIFAVCLTAMEIANIYAIIVYDGRWVEVLKSLGFVFIAALVMYLMTGIIRIIVRLIIKTFNKH